MALVSQSVAKKLDGKQKECVYHREQATREPMKKRCCCLANILGSKEADNGNSEQIGSQSRISFRSLWSVLSSSHS